ncbi:hypothetical protein TNIN_483211 [Trichonephila inaurata madagascariensis]|uniref:Uncharacterized protein n=1 Tax=Trichonephila inaurata madagascariensis TaxID=2747483 RepID=A0A8X6WR33_9ARAC|nr:hypothetical protein TNIN_483211 [Trichonephila inaurata madagascariensis]
MLLPLSQSFRSKPMIVQNLLVMEIYMSVFQFSAPFLLVLYVHTLFSVDFPKLRMNAHQLRIFCSQKRVTERNSHLAREANGSYIFSSCQAENEHCRQLAGAGTGRQEAKLYCSVIKSRATTFLAFAGLLESLF